MTKVVVDINHVASLSQLALDPTQIPALTRQLSATLKTISLLDQINTSGIEPTSQVTGLTNVTREDTVDSTRMLTQNQALSNAKQTYNGYFVVPAIL